jgi:ABC-type oligopeptide transport system substrate-binding subunit
VLATQEVEKLRTKRVRSVAFAAAVAAGLVLVVSACGGGGGGSGNSTSATTSSQATFPELKVVWGTTDYMDPGLSYRLESWQIFQDVYLGLVAKRYGTCGVGAGCTQIIPAIAEAMPKSNSDGTDL